MSFTKEQLRKFAKLSKIAITDEKLESMGISSVIEWIDKLQKIDTTGVEPMLSPVTGFAPMRADVVTDGDMRDLVLSNTPDDAGKSRGYFSVPKIMDGE